ncbi:MAG: DNA methyltransferase [Christensenellales bacterium]|jgi:site-specific DNA-methyltransferase (adenine-specific)
MRLEFEECTRHVLGSGLAGEIIQANAAELPAHILEDYRGRVQLIYLDPPFKTGQTFYYKRASLKITAYEDTWASDAAYAQMLKSVLENAHTLLSDTGLIYMHVDYRTAPHVRLIMDEIFGKEHFLNEIIWHYKSGGTAKKYFARKHDNILLYSKTKKYYFNIAASGVKRGKEARNHLKRNVDENGRVFWSIRSMGKLYKYYEDELVYPNDVWLDISHIQQRDPQRTGYDTQKPEKLLERIILTSSQEGDLVADLFAGSGTALAVACKQNRRFLGVENSWVGMQVMRKRLAGLKCDFAIETQQQNGAKELPYVKLRVGNKGSDWAITLLSYDAKQKEDRGDTEGIQATQQLKLSDLQYRQTELSFGRTQRICTADDVVYLAAGDFRGDWFEIKAQAVRNAAGLQNHLNFRALEFPCIYIMDRFLNGWLFRIME